MRKKVLSLVLSAAMVLSLTACGAGSSTTNDTTEGTNSQTESGNAETAQASGDVSTIKISYPCLSVIPTEEGTIEAENAINQYLEQKGEDVRIDLNPIDGNNYLTQVDMAIVGGEDMDIYCPFNGLDVAVESNKVLPLDDYLDNELAGAIEVMGEEFKKNCEYKGSTYALPPYKGSVMVDYWICPKDIFDSLGVAREDIQSIRDLTPVLAKIKELYPDMITIAPIYGTNGDPNSFAQLAVLGGVGEYEVTNLNNGIGVVGDDKIIRNIYDTDYFREACKIAYDWNQAGFVSKDASVSTDTPETLMQAGRAVSYIVGYAYDTDSVEALSQNYATPMDTVAIPIGKEMMSPIALYWAIAHTSKDPAGAAKVLNMLYTDEFVLNTLIYGVEGTDWVDAGTGDGSITWPEGKDMESVPYTAAFTCGIIGNQFKMYSMEGVSKASDIPFMADNMANTKKSSIFGFNVDVANIKNQTASVSNVLAQYRSGLLTGELNPDEYIPKMNQELEAAGIQDIIDEAQKQLDAWK